MMTKLLTICLAIGSITYAFADPQIYTVNIKNNTGEQISLFFPSSTTQDPVYHSEYNYYYGFTPVADKFKSVDSDQNYALEITHNGTSKGGIQQEYYSFFIEDRLIQLQTNEVYNSPHPAKGGERTKVFLDGQLICKSDDYVTSGDSHWNPTLTFNNDLTFTCDLH